MDLKHLKKRMAEFLERNPVFGIIASAGGLAAPLMSWLQLIGLLLGLGGAFFGLLAGFYTWKLSRAKARRLAAIEEQTCADCQRGVRPEVCPFVLADRPAACKHRDSASLLP